MNRELPEGTWKDQEIRANTRWRRKLPRSQFQFEDNPVLFNKKRPRADVRSSDHGNPATEESYKNPTSILDAEWELLLAGFQRIYFHQMQHSHPLGKNLRAHWIHLWKNVSMLDSKVGPGANCNPNCGPVLVGPTAVAALFFRPSAYVALWEYCTLVYNRCYVPLWSKQGTELLIYCLDSIWSLLNTRKSQRLVPSYCWTVELSQSL